MAEVTTHDGMIYGLEALVFNGAELGLISSDGPDWGGREPTTVKIWAAQRRNAPVKELLDNPGEDVITFDLIELKPANLKQVMGGTVSADGKRWDAPHNKIILEGDVVIRSADGSATEVARASLLAFPRGRYAHNDVFKIRCKLTILAPADDSSPYGIDTEPDAIAEG